MAKRKVIVHKGVKPKPKKSTHNYKGRVREFQLGSGLPSTKDILTELEGYRDVLFGREDPPLDKGVMTLMEVAEGYFSRACELEQLIYEAVRDGRLVGKEKAVYNQVRTQNIRSFKELAKSATELGSRRITFENLRVQQEMRGLESL
jgi:hypothetical protein